jgi:zinc/manganese transport system substrate-binding protein
MSRLAAFILLAGGLACAPAWSQSTSQPMTIVAAENFYGDVAQQIGGPEVKVTSILSNPDQDPHLFEASPSVARAMSAARIIVYNGIDYDPWMDKLVGAARNEERKTIVVAELIGRKAGDNPHIWYDPATMLTVAQALSDTLANEDPSHRADYERRLGHFRQSLEPIRTRIAALRERLSGTPATATEPVFDYMFAALGMDVRNQPFQLAVMNNTEPSASDVAAFENDLKTHQVKLLIYNSQATDPLAQRMEKLAKAFKVPVIGATETEPAGVKYQNWILGALEAVNHALPKHAQ